ncbi:hypothetical protein NP233_g7092 [Leucocoprinus birnbaumii]|uniref:CHAT domain-containing protein n=1 Tax=Leucocoprinus birnbaumii TaxID=56174 RepID=A0AAD5YUY0_9AGAR|nr:hypothetical protein NP233_g7092 [Leucocoprinus birnbaumii]
MNMQTALEGARSEYGNLTLKLGVLLASRFVTSPEESGALTVSKKLEDTILCYNHNINNESHDDHYHWQHYRLLIAQGDLVLKFQALEARLVCLQAPKAQPLDLSHQTEAFTFHHIKSTIATSKSNASGPSMSMNPTNESLVAATDTENGSPSPPAYLVATSQIDVCMALLLGADDEIKICDYSFLCHVLGLSYYLCYQVAKHASDLEEAMEYTVTAYQLLADTNKIFPERIYPTKTILLSYVEAYSTQSPHLSTLSIDAFSGTVLGQFATSCFQSTDSEPLSPSVCDGWDSDNRPENEMSAETFAKIYHRIFSSSAQPSLLQSSFTSPPPIWGSEMKPIDIKVDIKDIYVDMWIGIILCMTVLFHIEGDKTEVCKYADYCNTLACDHFFRYPIRKDGSHLEEAAELSATAYQLAADRDNVSLELMKKTAVILVAYLGAYIAYAYSPSGIPVPLPSINVLETFGMILDHFPDLPIDPPLYTWRCFLTEVINGIYLLSKTNLRYLDMTIAQYEKAFECQHPMGQDMRWTHDTLGWLLIHCYSLYGDSNNLDAAINNLKVAEMLKPSYLGAGVLGMALSYKISRQPPGLGLSSKDKEEMISYFMKAAQIAEQEQNRLFSSQMQQDLGTALIHLYKKYGNEEDLTQGIQHLEKSLPDSPARYIILSTLADAYRLRSSKGDKERAMQCMAMLEEEGAGEIISSNRLGPHRNQEKWKRKAYEKSSTTPISQFRDGLHWGEVALGNKHPDCLEAFKISASLLLKVAAMGIKIEDGHQRLEVIQHFGGPAAAAAVKFAMANLAVEWLELEEIQRKPGMENFLQPLPFHQLAEAARHGPVILLSSDEITQRAYAFIIVDPNQEKPITVPLPKAPHQHLIECRDYISQLLKSLGVQHFSAEEEQLERAGRVAAKKRHQKSRTLSDLLGGLWKTVVEPMYDELEKNNISLGRVWWCPTRVFTSLPIHAARPITCPLGSASSKRSGISSLQFSAVGIGEYPGRPKLALPAVSQEVHTLGEFARGNVAVSLHTIKNNEASVNVVLSAIKSSQFVHLACHGIQDSGQPLNSHLMLTDGNLELRRILAEDLESAEFVSLSACQTATGNHRLTNEAAHLTGGFVAAGFKGVVGTLWSIANEDALGVMKEVYETMQVDGDLDITLAAEGLDRAVWRMRKSGMPAHQWAPFIHVGV